MWDITPQTVRDGRGAIPDFCYWDFPLIELDGLVMGIVGFGELAGGGESREGFGMRVLASRRSGGADSEAGVEFVELGRCHAQRATVVSLHCPLTPETKHLVERAAAGLMKPTAFLLNTAAGFGGRSGACGRA